MLNVYYVCVGIVTDWPYDPYEAPETYAAMEIVIATSRGQARKMMVSEYDLEFTAPMQMLKIASNGEGKPRILNGKEWSWLNNYEPEEEYYAMVNWEKVKDPKEIADYS